MSALPALAAVEPEDLELLDVAIASYAICPVNSDLAHAIVLEREATLDIGFQGTHPERVKDLVIDGLGEALEVPKIGPVHAGFWRSSCSIAWLLLPVAAKAKAAGKRVRLTGHSKGGAEAQNFAVMLLLALGYLPDRLSLFEPACALGPQGLALIAGVPGVAIRYGADQIPFAAKSPIANRPLWQLGSPALHFDLLTDHQLATVGAALRALPVQGAMLSGGEGAISLVGDRR
jgi:hypothetical protein